MDASTSSLSTPSSLPTSHGPLRQFLLPISPIPMLHCRPFAPTCKNWDCPTFGRDLVPFHTLMVAKQWPQLSPTSLCPLPLAVSPHGPWPWPCVLLGNGRAVHVTQAETWTLVSHGLSRCSWNRATRLTRASQLQTEGTYGGETTAPSR